MKPNYIAKTSIWRDLRMGHIFLWLALWGIGAVLCIFGWEIAAAMNMIGVLIAVAAVFLLVPIVWYVCMRLNVSCDYLEFYNEKIIQRWGFWSKRHSSKVFMGVTSTNVDLPLRGRIFNYGHVFIDCAGKWDFDARYVKNPYRLERYLNTKVVKAKDSGRIVQM